MASSGTAGAVSHLLASHGVTDGRLTPWAIAWCIERCVEAGHVQELQLRGLKDERKPVLAGGLAILYTLMVQFRIPEIQPSKAALRQGVIFDLHRRLALDEGLQQLDVRDATVRQLQKRFEVDAAQARRVRQIALALQGELLPELSGEERRELAWACELHEMGMMVSHHDHHRHSAYLLSHADAAGFSQSQQRRIADLVLGQRGGLRKVESAFSRRHFAAQLLCLRVAVLCCHGRHRGDRIRVQAQWDRPGEIRLSWDAAAADGRSSASELRTQHLLREEVSAWARVGTLRVRWSEPRQSSKQFG